METLQIKEMVCQRCITVVRNGLEQMGYAVQHAELGTVNLQGSISHRDREQIGSFLEQHGFSLHDSRATRLITQIKLTIEQRLEEGEDRPAIRLSDQLAEQLHINYDSLSELFSRSEGLTLEKYVILQRINKAKEKLVYTRMTLTDISRQLGYSSIQHLSRQFKEITGFTPSHFRSMYSKQPNPKNYTSAPDKYKSQ